MLLTASDALASPARRSPTPFYRRNLLSSVVFLAALLGLFVWVNLPARAVDLGAANHLEEAGVVAAWHRGDVVVLVRHAERCDRSNNSCLADASGITIEGNGVSSEVGTAFKRLGLAQTDIYSSPMTRTVQTAVSMFGKGVATQAWLGNCKTSLQGDILTHKTAGRNLVLVTHSGCINGLEEQLNASGASYDSQYASALFVAMDKASGKPQLLGFLNADDWAAVTQEAGI